MRAVDRVSGKHPDLHRVLTIDELIVAPGSRAFLVGVGGALQLADDLFDLSRGTIMLPLFMKPRLWIPGKALRMLSGTYAPKRVQPPEFNHGSLEQRAVQYMKILPPNARPGMKGS